MTETWLPVVDAEESHSVSNEGHVRSEDRMIMVNGSLARRDGKILKGQPNSKGYLRVWICGKQRFIHHMVLQSFEGTRPDGLWALHWDDDHSNNAWSNLYYGTPTQNGEDLVRNGNNLNANKAECVNGHAYTPENTITRKGNSGRTGRNCRECARKRSREYMRRKAKQAKDLQLNTHREHQIKGSAA